MFKNWKEYLDNRGKIVEKPPVEQIPDYTGPQPTAPEKAETPKQLDKANNPPKCSKIPSPYKPATKGTPATKKEAGLADKGKKAEMPKVGGDYKGKTLPSYPKTKTESFLEKTKDMSLQEFVDHMIKECGCGCEQDDELPAVTSYAAGKFHPYPPEAIRYVVALAKKNPRIMEHLVHELKSQDGLSDMLGAAMDHPETIDHLTDLLGDEEKGPQHARSIVKSIDNKYNKFLDDHSDMYESVAPPFGIDDEENEESPEDHNDQDEDMDKKDDDELPTVEPKDDDKLSMNNDDDQNQDKDQDNDQTDDEQGQEKPRMLKKKFAHDHLIEAMSGVDHMRDKMKHHLGQ